MKLVFAHDHTFYNYNGIYYSSGGLSKEMLERYTKIFEEVVVVSRQKEVKKLSDKLTVASTERVKFVSVPNFKTLKTYHKKRIAKSIIDKEVEKSDALIARNSSIADLAINSAKKYRKPYLIEMVSCPWDSYWNHSRKGKLMAPYKYFSTKNKVKEAPYVIYVTNEFLQNRYPTKGKNTNCSNVSLTEFDEVVIENRINKIKSIKKEEKIIIGTTAAVNVKYKGQQYIIQALGELKNKGITKFEYHLVGAGDHTYLSDVAKKNGVENQVKFLGTMPHDEVFQWLETIDIYTQPSKQEGLPRGLIEAMSRGLPAFGAKTAGIPELLSSDFIFEHGTNSIDEICKILLSFDKKTMLEQADKNYQESKKYDKKIIEERRTKFLNEFKHDIT